MYTKRLLSVVLFAFVALRPVKSLSREEVFAANLATRYKCIEESGTTNEMVEKMHQGEFPDDRNLKCFTACAMRAFQCVSPEDTLDFEVLDDVLSKFLNPVMHAQSQKVVNHCRVQEFSSDLCEASYQYARCYYEFDTEFVFP